MIVIQDHPIDPLNPVIRMGGCSYGELDPRAYPYYNVIAIHPNSELLKGLKTHGCGACFEVQCIDGEAVSDSCCWNCINPQGKIENNDLTQMHVLRLTHLLYVVV